MASPIRRICEPELNTRRWGNQNTLTRKELKCRCDTQQPPSFKLPVSEYRVLWEVVLLYLFVQAVLDGFFPVLGYFRTGFVLQYKLPQHHKQISEEIDVDEVGVAGYAFQGTRQ